MQVHIDRLGSTAMMMLLRILRGETLGGASATILTPTLVARGTTGGARAEAPQAMTAQP